MQDSVMSMEYKMPYENDRQLVDEEKSMQILNATVRKIQNQNRYEAELLWKEETEDLPTQSSYVTAVKRLRILIKHLVRIGQYDEIRSQIENLEKKNYARRLTWQEIQNPPKRAFYIPIFIIDPKGKKILYVKSMGNLYVDILSMLMRAREGKYFVKADIAEMFHQVVVKVKDRPAFRFLFMELNGEKFIHYEMNVLIFGAICAPTISQFVKNKIAEDHRHIHPQAAETLKSSMYVDDYAVSFNNLQEGQSLIKGARPPNASGGNEFDEIKRKSPQHT